MFGRKVSIAGLGTSEYPAISGPTTPVTRDTEIRVPDSKIAVPETAMTEAVPLPGIMINGLRHVFQVCVDALPLAWNAVESDMNTETVLRMVVA